MDSNLEPRLFAQIMALPIVVRQELLETLGARPVSGEKANRLLREALAKQLSAS